MAKLQRGDEEQILGIEQDIGRAPRSEIKLSHASVSSLHATLRFREGAWAIKDLASTNGTFVDGERVRAQTWHPLKKGSKIVFGEDEAFTLTDASPPCPILEREGGPPLLVSEGSIALPNEEDPRATLYLGSDGLWRVEMSDTAHLVENGQSFKVGDITYRFDTAHLKATTPTSRISLPLALSSMSLRLNVSQDEEHVTAMLASEQQTFDLGARAHHALLLALARARLEDAAQNLPASSCGFVYQDDLAKALGLTPEHVNVDVFRVRKQVSALGLEGGAEIIERKPRSGQLRIGLGKITVQKG
jgi:FHA domain